MAEHETKVRVRFLPEDISVEAAVGEPWLAVAERAQVVIPTGCLMGSCGACVVDLEGNEMHCCISSVPPAASPLTVTLFSDPTW